MVLRDLRVVALHLLIIEVVNKNDSGLLLHIIRWIVWNRILMQVIKHDFVIIRSPVRRIVATPLRMPDSAIGVATRVSGITVRRCRM